MTSDSYTHISEVIGLIKNGKRKTGWVCSELYMWHDTQHYNLTVAPSLTVQPGEHVENEETKRRFRNLVEVSGLLDELTPIKPRAATNDELLRFHSERHMRFLEDLCSNGGGLAGNKTPVGPASFEIAKLAAGGAIEAMDAVLDGSVQNAYVLCRPPGHHAEADSTFGFCLLANGVIAIEHARAVRGVERVAVVDWDVHHGNSAETAYYDDPNVLSISVHQDNLFPPNRGAIGDCGTGAGIGANINVPLPPGSGSGAYRAAFDEIVIPALRDFAPELIVVSCGFDASALDPMAHMMLCSEDYRYMTQALLNVANEQCDDRVVFTHEGGYSAAYVPYCGLAVIEEMRGIRTHVSDPFLDYVSNFGGQAIQPHQQTVIAQAVRSMTANATKPSHKLAKSN